MVCAGLVMLISCRIACDVKVGPLCVTIDQRCGYEIFMSVEGMSVVKEGEIQTVGQKN